MNDKEGSGKMSGFPIAVSSMGDKKIETTSLETGNSCSDTW
jgi:hypothetical protein